MGYAIDQGQTAQPLVFLLVLSSDHLTGATGKTPTVTLSKNGAVFAAPAGAVSEIGNGWYQVAGNATDSNTLGPLLLHATATACDPVDDCFPVVAYNPQDGAALGLSRLDAVVSSRMATFTLPANFAALAITVGGAVTAGTVGDKTGYSISGTKTTLDALNDITAASVWAAATRTLTASLDPTAAQIATQVWQDLVAGSDFGTAGSIGVLITSDLNTALSTVNTNVLSRLAASSYTTPPTTAQIASAILVTPANLLTTDATGRVTAGTVSDKTGYSLAAAGLDAVVVETGLNVRQALSLIAAACDGVVSGGGTTTVTFLGAGVATQRIQATVDGSGNRSAVILSPPA